MADIVSALDKMNDVEVTQDAPHSEALMNKIGANINALIDMNTVTIFTSSGSYEIPTNATGLVLAACGGGGGGAGGLSNHPGAIDIWGPQGGAGCPLKVMYTPVVGGETATITIGSGGAGSAAVSSTPGNSGSNGGDTIFSTSTYGAVTFYGGKGGRRLETDTEITTTEASYPFYVRQPLADNQTMGGFLYMYGASASVTFAAKDSMGYLGGGDGARSGAQLGGGGGGAGSFGPGGDGAAGNTGTAGSAAGATHYGSGGGAGAFRSSTAGAGGAGAAGILIVLRVILSA